MRRVYPEFEEQSFTQLIFPHPFSDWSEYLQEAVESYVKIIKTISKFQKTLIICDDIKRVQSYFENRDNLFFLEYLSDDTWARDCSALSVKVDNEPMLLDFTFTAWGDKFESSKDNLLSSTIQNVYGASMMKIDLILEGGGVEFNGDGIMLTTSKCLKNSNRNSKISDVVLENELKDIFGLKKILWLNHGYLSGDDTDSHIDTLARFISYDTIVYTTCSDENDEHYTELKLMEKELQSFTCSESEAFNLIPLPLPSPIYYNNERLPATYANFIFVNGGVIVPTYGVKEDEVALNIFRKTFLKREVVGVDCSVLIREHGSLHCITMQFPKDVVLSTECFKV
ncbi:MAG: agmatine deiminase family protein [Campylobacterota bacterium]|nr:agmatine deiminase family protein [Campylobacterota bacterium]